LASLVTSLVASAVQLVLGLVTVVRQANDNQPSKSTQPGHPSAPKRNECQRKLRQKQAHRAMHQPRIRVWSAGRVNWSLVQG